MCLKTMPNSQTVRDPYSQRVFSQLSRARANWKSVASVFFPVCAHFFLFLVHLAGVCGELGESALLANCDSPRHYTQSSLYTQPVCQKGPPHAEGCWCLCMGVFSCVFIVQISRNKGPVFLRGVFLW